MASIKKLVRPALFVLLVTLSLLFLPLVGFMLATILLITGFVLWDARKNRILFKMAVRSVVRRKATTALVLGGLMVGTAIIASSFVVGDTMDNMIVGEVTKGAGEMDFLIGAPTDNGWNFFNASAQQSVAADVSAVDGVEHVEWVLLRGTGILDNTSRMTTSATFMGVNTNLTERFGGFVDLDGNRITEVPAAGHVYMNQRLAKELDAHEGDQLVLPRGNATVTLTVDKLVQDKYLGGFETNTLIFMDMESGQAIAGHPGENNFVMVALDGSVGPTPQDTAPVKEGIEQALAAYHGSGLTVRFDKSVELEEGKQQMATFTSLFLVMGSFSIIAGIALVISIFTMLGEERKSEMGMSRAIGMQRVHLRKLFTYEGLIYALLAAGIGAVVGVVLAYFIIIGFSMVIDMGGVQMDQYFTFTPFSVAIAYMGGFLLTIATVFLTTYRISNMNIVRAVRNIPEPPVTREDRKTFRMGAMGIVGGALLMVLGISTEGLAASLSGLSLVLISAGLLLRKYIGDRVAWNAVGFASLFIWLPLPFDIFPYTGNIEMFAVAGIFMVTSVLVLVMANSDQIIGFLTKLLRVKGGYVAVVKTAISYPLKAKFRTALSIFIFGLVIFTVTVLSMMSGIMAVGIPQMMSETSGGFDVVGFTNPNIPVTTDLWDEIKEDKGLLHKENVSNVIPLVSSTPYFIKGSVPQLAQGTTYDMFRYTAMGVNSRFYTEGDYPLKEWNESLYANSKAAWDAVVADPTLCVIDGSGSAQMQYGMGPTSSVTGLKVGDQVTMVVSDGVSPPTAKVLTIAGIMKQSFFNGVFVSENLVKDELKSPYPTVFLVKIAAGVDADRQAILLEKDFLKYNMNTISMSSMAKEATSQIDGIFNLLKAFLAMGLIIGISGLGIITIRSINERRVEIGMMRAIGYTRRMVVTNFAMESAFISIIGIVGGTLLGIVVGYSLWETAFQPMGMGFVIAWWPILLVGAGAFVATILSVYPAARGASRVSPAEVLRFE